MDLADTMDARLWAALPDGNASTQRCLELNLDAVAASATLARANCTDQKKPFVCQVAHLSNKLSGRLNFKPIFQNFLEYLIVG
jgi:hypothetical protein